ncbi:hypothetical protein LC612_31095 [Nostoc sp. CHAB 5834]|nr:hypothetical protein [Nostoc sp. CHAB 5834]
MNTHTPVGFILGLASSVLVIASPNPTVKTLSTISLGIGLGVVASSQIGDKESENRVTESQRKIENIEHALKLVNTRNENLNSKIEDLKMQHDLEKFKLEKDIKELLSQIEDYKSKNIDLQHVELELRGELKQAEKDLENKIKELKIEADNKVREVSIFSESSAYAIANKTYEDELKQLEGLVSGNKRNYPELKKFFENLESEIDYVKSKAVADLENYSGVRNLQSLIDDGLSIQQKIISRCSSIKVKVLTRIVRYLNDILNDSVALSDLQNHLSDLTEKAGLVIQSKQNEVEQVASDWLESNAKTTQLYETEFTEALENGKYLMKRIDELNERVEQLSKPLTWHFANRQDLQIGNIIIAYFERMGLILDRGDADFDHWQSTLSFHIDRNNRIITVDELEPEAERLQQLCHTLSPVKFGWDTKKGQITAWLHLAKQPTKQIIESDINKIWKSADKFSTIVKDWSRIRLTGGSESGKSPTAENIAICILLGKGGSAELFNPQFESIKNYWSIPVVGHSHEDSLKGIAELAESVNGKNFDNFKLTIFDEIDSTMVSVDKKEQGGIGQQISTIIKQISHKGGGAIFIGQNANASQYPGMDRSDWNSAVNVHIGSNAYDALTNTNQVSKDDQARLKQQADRLTEFCNEKNSELGLEKTNPEAYRFALVMNDGKSPYFIQLPNFGEYQYDLITEAEKCPKCESTKLVKNGGNRRKCKQCDNSFTL